jgi:hypothetical protein
MELTPEERQRIYLEEKARIEIRNQLQADIPHQAATFDGLKERPSNGIAAVLSLIIPGAGQMYKGKTGQGIVWLAGTVIAYMLLIVPGLIVHLVCVFHAASMEPEPS